MHSKKSRWLSTALPTPCSGFNLRSVSFKHQHQSREVDLPSVPALERVPSDRSNDQVWYKNAGLKVMIQVIWRLKVNAANHQSFYRHPQLLPPHQLQVTTLRSLRNRQRMPTGAVSSVYFPFFDPSVSVTLACKQTLKDPGLTLLFVTLIKKS